MELRNCASCGKMFNYVLGSAPICQECAKKMDEKFNEVKQYVYDHPGCSINDVVRDMEVTANQVRKWIREEKLSFSESSDIAIQCEGCGARILTGRYCKECKTNMINGMNGLYKKEAPKEEPKKPTHDNRMRFLDK